MAVDSFMITAVSGAQVSNTQGAEEGQWVAEFAVVVMKLGNAGGAKCEQIGRARR